MAAEAGGTRRQARRRFQAFAARFREPQAYHDLAYHAAVPLVLTPDLLYKIWSYFRVDRYGQRLNIPWEAVGDLLLAEFCARVGRDMVEVDRGVRHYLLERLEIDDRFGLRRRSELAQFLQAYVRAAYPERRGLMGELAEAQEWAAVAYLQPGTAATRLAQAYRRAGTEDEADHLRLAGIVDSLAAPLAEADPALLDYARGLAHRARGETTAATGRLGALGPAGSSVSIAGVPLTVPEVAPAGPDASRPPPGPDAEPATREPPPVGAPAFARPRDHALVIGLDHYPRFENLSGAVADARAMADWLTSPEGGGLPVGQVTVQISLDDPGGSVGRKDVDAALDTLGQRLHQTPAERLYVYFSGHGRVVGDDVHLCLGAWSPEAAGETVSLEQLGRRLATGLPLKELVLLADIAPVASGTRGRAPGPSWPELTGAEPPAELVIYNQVRPGPAVKGVPTPTAAFPYRGYLTRAWLDALQGAVPRGPDGVPATALAKQLPELVDMMTQPVEAPQRAVVVLRQGERLAGFGPPVSWPTPLTLVFRRAFEPGLTLAGPDQEVVRDEPARAGDRWELRLPPGRYRLHHPRLGWEQIIDHRGAAEVEVGEPGDRPLDWAAPAVDTLLALGRQDDGLVRVELSLAGPSPGTAPVSATVRLDRQAMPRPGRDPRTAGRWLADRLFEAPELPDALRAARDQSLEQGRPWRLRLNFRNDVDFFHDFPWEALPLPGDERPLAEQAGVLFQRFVAGSAERPVTPGPYRQAPALALLGGPDETTDLRGQRFDRTIDPVDLDQAAAWVRRLLGSRVADNIVPAFYIDEVPAYLGSEGDPSSTAGLRPAPAVLFLTGRVARLEGEPVIWTGDGGAFGPRPMATLPQALALAPVVPRLVVLAGPGGGDLWPGLARELVVAGVPDVLVTAGADPDTADTYLVAFFEELDDHDRVERAAAGARQAVAGRSGAAAILHFTRLTAGELPVVTEREAPASDEPLGLRIRALQTGGYPVLLTLGQAEAEGPFLPPDILRSWEEARQKPDAGAWLFDQLLATEEARLFWLQATETGPRPVWLWCEPGAEGLETIAWERLADTTRGAPRPLAAGPETPFFRRVAGNWLAPPDQTTRQTRILVALASPRDLERYELEPIAPAGQEAMMQAVAEGARLAGVDPDLTLMSQGVTLRALEEQLAQGYDALHLICHDLVDRKGEAFRFVLEDERGQVDLVEAARLVELLQRLDRPPAFVFLASSIPAVVRQIATTAVVAALGLPRGGLQLTAIAALSQAFYADFLAQGRPARAANALRARLLADEKYAGPWPVLYAKQTIGPIVPLPATPEPAGPEEAAEGLAGWAHGDFFDRSEDEGVVRAASGLNLRAGPGTDHERLGILPQGARVRITGPAQGDWLPVQARPADLQPRPAPEAGDDEAADVAEATLTGWIHAAFVYLAEPGEDGARVIPLKARLRQDTGSGAPSLGFIEPWATVSITGDRVGEFVPVSVPARDVKQGEARWNETIHGVTPGYVRASALALIDDEGIVRGTVPFENAFPGRPGGELASGTPVIVDTGATTDVARAAVQVVAAHVRSPDDDPTTGEPPAPAILPTPRPARLAEEELGLLLTVTGDAVQAVVARGDSRPGIYRGPFRPESGLPRYPPFDDARALLRQGESLFGALFHDTTFPGDAAQRATANAYQALARSLNEGVVALETTPALAALPWEAIAEFGGVDALAVRRQTRFARYVRVDLPGPRPALLAQSLRLLLVAAAGYLPDLPEVDPGRELARWTRALDQIDRDRLNYQVQDHDYWPAVLETLNQSFNVLHMVAPVIVVEDRPRLVLTGDEKGGRPAAADRVAADLASVGDLRLLILSLPGSTPPEAGAASLRLGHELVAAGLPAVLVLPLAPHPQTARWLVERFYPLLAGGEPVDRALAEARRHIWEQEMEYERERGEWALPALFLAHGGGPLFAPASPTQDKAREAPGAPAGSPYDSATARAPGPVQPPDEGPDRPSDEGPDRPPDEDPDRPSDEGPDRPRGRVFFSYARRDAAPVVQRLASDLAQDGWLTWLDVADIEPGRDLASAIIEAVAGSDIFLQVISPAALVSEWFDGELREATRLEKPVVQVLALPTELPPDRQAERPILLYEDYEAGLEELKGLLGLLMADSTVDDWELRFVRGEVDGESPAEAVAEPGPADARREQLRQQIATRQQAIEAKELLLSSARDAGQLEAEIEADRRGLVDLLGELERLQDAPGAGVSATGAEPGDRRVWPADGKEMVSIPAGLFLFGQDREADKLPAFWIDRAPVTNAEYLRFVEAAGHAPPPHWERDLLRGQLQRRPPKDILDQPVVQVSWEDARAYAAWAGKRLPTDREWERAARGTDGRNYPWGDAWQPGLANTREAGVDGPTPVGQYAPAGDSPAGCVDMAGNVWEWTATADPADRARIVKGGSYADDQTAAQCWVQGRYRPEVSRRFFGFRCAADPPEPA